MDVTFDPADLRDIIREELARLDVRALVRAEAQRVRRVEAATFQTEQTRREQQLAEGYEIAARTLRAKAGPTFELVSTGLAEPLAWIPMPPGGWRR